MKKLHARKGGFTLIELMIVVAIIGILAAIAIPNFLQFQLRSKTSEGKTNLAGIRTAQESYAAELDTYIAALRHPRAVPDNQKVTWILPAAGFDTIGWAPEGDVYFVYDVVSGATTDYLATATSDIDFDGTQAEWIVGKDVANPGALLAGPGPLCAAVAQGQVSVCEANNVF
jgi:type IV pilus assembly protein PilA